MVNELLVQQYCDLSKARAEAQKANGGSLDEDAEEAFLGPMDTLWYQMSADDHREVLRLNKHVKPPKPT